LVLRLKTDRFIIEAAKKKRMTRSVLSADDRNEGIRNVKP
jgi:hypothetical protein